MNYLEQINVILQFFINISISIGIICLIFFYSKLYNLDKKIEKIEKELEQEKIKKQEQKIPIEYIRSQIEKLENDKVAKLAPLKREHARIVSKIPFLR